MLVFFLSAAVRNHQIVLGNVTKLTNKSLSVTLINIKDFCDYY